MLLYAPSKVMESHSMPVNDESDHDGHGCSCERRLVKSIWVVRKISAAAHGGHPVLLLGVAAAGAASAVLAMCGLHCIHL